jgi:hypothetical protein
LTNGRDLGKIVATAREHYKALSSDIANAKDRQEHIRITALAQEAHNLLTDLIEFETGLDTTSTANDEPLDLPEFKSPYQPPTE